MGNSSAVGAEPSVRDRILDSAEACLMDFGHRRTTLNEIARRSELSRTTIYNHFTNRDRVVAALMRREVTRFGSALAARLDAQTSIDDVVVEAVVGVVGLARTNAPFRRLMELEPDLVLPWFTTRSDTLLTAFGEVVSPALRDSPDRERLRTDDPDLAARWIVRVALSLILAPEARELDGDGLRSFVRTVILYGLVD